MNSSIHRFSLDIQSAQSQISIPVMLGDTGRTFRITLSDGGNPYIITKGCLAKITINRPTGTHLEEFCDIENETTIVYPFSKNKNTVAVKGIHDCDVSLYGVDGEKLTTARFTMVVSETVENKDYIVLNDEDYRTLDAIVTAEASRVSAEEVRVTEENKRLNAERDRETAEKKREQTLLTLKENLENAITSAQTAATNANNLRVDLENKLNRGDFNGASAYEVAKTNGFTGTEKEWLESLKANCECDGTGGNTSGGTTEPPPEPDDNPVTPSVSYKVYYGSVDRHKEENDLNADLISSFVSVENKKKFTAIFEGGTNRFVVAFPTNYATNLSVTANPGTPAFEEYLTVGDDATYDVVRMDYQTINELTYTVYAYDVASNRSSGEMLINLT